MGLKEGGRGPWGTWGLELVPRDARWEAVVDFGGGKGWNGARYACVCPCTAHHPVSSVACQ